MLDPTLRLALALRIEIGTTDGILFRPDLHEHYEGTNQYIKNLDDILALVRQVAQEALDKRTGTRQAQNPIISTQYQPGDFLLFSVPKMSRNSKLSTPLCRVSYIRTLVHTIPSTYTH